MHPAFLAASSSAIPLELVTAKELGPWTKEQTGRIKTLVEATAFRADAGKTLTIPNAEGGIEKVIVGVGDASDGYVLASLPGSLPPGDYALGPIRNGMNAETLSLGWADGAYRFTKYKSSTEKPRRLVLPSGADEREVTRQAEAIDWLRDLVNTPPCDMGPVEIAAAASAMAKEFGAEVSVTEGKALEEGFPMVYAVGKGAVQGPRFVEITWGKESDPKVAIVGKGVAFDTGGLNLKGGDNMRLMKKDMGGAAHALAIARLIMDAKLPVRLSCITPLVENAIGPNAFRPSDVYKTRKGLTVEIEDTDAEGRLVLADALTRASELKPELIIDFATLTGAARTALGPDLAPLYTDDDKLAEALMAGSKATGDPMWRMPLWANYEGGLKSPIADLKNLGDGPMGGSITAALFLKAFVSAPSWAHFDIWSWRQARYGRPAGAAACGLRAVWSMLKTRYGK
ncbi:MAG TPA: leucyl aminopeptidase family protein [Hyphomonadaceae bacterium]|jgi:leucyl aminopeptidase|nr:leucyl aminopeptidase family protein [Hyphomonadaceae bacterium]